MHRLINRMWRWSGSRDVAAFQRAIGNPLKAQTNTLRRQLRVLADSQQGRRWALSRNLSVGDFRRRVPLTRFEDYRDAIDTIEHSGFNALSSEKVLLLEPTSGSRFERKLIPYTKSLRSEFQSALAVWVHDLFSKRPQTMDGPAYWSISPPLQSRTVSRGGVPVGFADDSAYLGFWSRRLARRMLAVPNLVLQLTEANEWKYATAWYLAQTPNLALISVWSPTFLLDLFDGVGNDYRARLARDLHDGQCRVSSSARAINENALTVRNKRACRLAASLLDGGTSAEQLAVHLWPLLKVISCWTDGASGRYIPELETRFPQAEISPKGLLSTEACVSIPLIDEPGAALALGSHFFEFCPNSGDPKLAHELVHGQRYQVIVTTGGGLCRYQTGDWVEVTGSIARCPLVRFVGRDSTSDLVGEKIDELFVQQVLQGLWNDGRGQPGFEMLIPDQDDRRYHLFIEKAPDGSTGVSYSQASMQARLDQLLRRNPYYDQARNLGQLSAVRIVVDSSDSGRFRRCYERAAVSQGTCVGDIKPTVLETNPRRAAEFLRLQRSVFGHR